MSSAEAKPDKRPADSHSESLPSPAPVKSALQNPTSLLLRMTEARQGHWDWGRREKGRTLPRTGAPSVRVKNKLLATTPSSSPPEASGPWQINLLHRKGGPWGQKGKDPHGDTIWVHPSTEAEAPQLLPLGSYPFSPHALSPKETLIPENTRNPPVP